MLYCSPIKKYTLVTTYKCINYIRPTVHVTRWSCAFGSSRLEGPNLVANRYCAVYRLYTMEVRKYESTSEVLPEVYFRTKIVDF
jgi:hypothetical protein